MPVRTSNPKTYFLAFSNKAIIHVQEQMQHADGCLVEHFYKAYVIYWWYK